MKITSAEALSQAKEIGRKLLFPEGIRINVGMSTCCIAKGADVTFNALEYGVTSNNINAVVVPVGCSGLCHLEPVIEVQVPGKPKVVYGNVTEQAVPRILQALADGSIVADLAVARVESEDHVVAGKLRYGSADDVVLSAIPERGELALMRRQKKIILRNAGTINPEDIYEYIARGGYQAAAKALAMPPAKIVEQVTKAGLCGRGGGGFPTGLKWKMCREARGAEKYLICNVSEGEPGIGMHRSFLESDPHSVIEGLIIGAHAIGARTAYVYIRDNYRLALRRFNKAVESAAELGLLGDNIMGGKLSFSIKVKEGGGRFVCGEETALIACIEGRIGEPRQRPPFPTVKGLFGKPTCINNVETWANIPIIVLKGAAWYSAMGSKTSKGTKVLSLAGNIAKAGMIEVEMGTTLKDVINDIGGGMANKKKLKAIQTGGPSGGVLPASRAKLPIEYEALRSEGSMLGSGGMVFMDDSTDMVKIARYFTDFFVQESCGKCVPCREGVCRLRDILDEILDGRGTPQLLKQLKDLSGPITQASACALGKTAPVPILSTLKHFKADYQSYIK